MYALYSRVFREIQLIEENDFNFQDDPEPVDYVEKICESMQVAGTLYTVITN